MRQPAFIVISDGKGDGKRLLHTAMTLSSIIDVFMLREKQWTARQMWEWGEALLAAGFPPQKLFINDRADVALALSAGGVHLAGHSLPAGFVKQIVPPEMKIGVSVHSLAEARHAVSTGAHYVMYGHIFPSPSKPGLPARGIEALKKMVMQMPIPVIAVGGIDAVNVATVLDTGCAGVAVISAVMGAADPRQAARNIAGRLHSAAN